MTLIELVVATALSLLAFAFFGTILQQNSNTMTRARTRIFLLSQETLMGQLFSDTKTCHCTLDMRQAGNPYRDINGNQGIKVSSNPIPLPAITLFPKNQSTGACDYTGPGLIPIAVLGDPLSPELSHITTEGIFLRDMVKVNNVTDDVHRYKGTLTATFRHMNDPSKNIPPLKSDIYFYVNASTGESMGCDITKEAEEAYAQRFEQQIDDQVELTRINSSGDDIAKIWADFKARIQHLKDNEGYK